MNISSIVIQTKPLHVKEIIAICEASDYCDYHFSDEEKGKIVVTIEGENLDEEMAKMNSMRNEKCWSIPPVFLICSMMKRLISKISFIRVI